MRLLSQLLLLSSLAIFTLVAPARAQDNLYSNARSLVDRVQSDLGRASHISHDKKERERYQNAERSLSDFDRNLARNKFDKDKLDSAINDVKNVVEHNTLDPEARDALNQDLRDLRSLRQARGAGY
jgi:hypothetical protein